MNVPNHGFIWGFTDLNRPLNLPAFQLFASFKHTCGLSWPRITHPYSRWYPRLLHASSRPEFPRPNVWTIACIVEEINAHVLSPHIIIWLLYAYEIWYMLTTITISANILLLMWVLWENDESKINNLHLLHKPQVKLTTGGRRQKNR